MIISVSIFLFATLSSSFSSAAPFTPTHCPSSFNKKLQDLGSLNQWQSIAGWSHKKIQFRSPTKKFGQWLQVEKDIKSGRSQIRVFDPYGETLYQVSSPQKCRYRGKVVKKFKKRSRFNFGLNDQGLKKLISKKQGILLFWSPSMVYSVERVNIMKQFARNLGLPFFSFVDERASQPAIAKAMKKYSISPQDGRRIASTEMDMRGYKLHFPVVYVFKNGRIHSERMAGVVDELEFSLNVHRRLKELK